MVCNQLERKGINTKLKNENYAEIAVYCIDLKLFIQTPIANPTSDR